MSERGGSESRDRVRGDRGREGEERENGERVENVPGRLLACKVLNDPRRMSDRLSESGGGGGNLRGASTRTKVHQ